MRKKLLSNWGLKLASLVLAVVLWFIVIDIDDPIDDKTFWSANVQIKFSNTDIITDQDMVYEILENTGIVKTITFDAPKTIRDEIEASDIIAEADFNDLTVTNTLQIKFSCPKYSEVTNITGNIDNVKLNIEAKKTRWINLDYEVTGEVAEGFMIGNIRLDQNRLEVSGPESLVSSIEKAVIEVNVKDINSNISTQVDVRMLDAEGNEISSTSLNKNFSVVRVSVDILALKEVPIEVLVDGVPADGFLYTGTVVSSPSKVEIAGSSSLLSDISKITIPADELDLTGRNENLTKVIDITNYLPENITFADSDFNGKITVIAYIEQESEKYIQIPLRNIQIKNIPEGYIIEIPEDTDVPILHVTGLPNDIASLVDNGVTGEINMSEWMEDHNVEELTEGIYNAEVTFTLSEKQTQVNSITVPIAISVY